MTKLSPAIPCICLSFLFVIIPKLTSRPITQRGDNGLFQKKKKILRIIAGELNEYDKGT